jgi:hypothetical protein
VHPAFLVDQLVRNSLQLRVAVTCSAPSHYIASSRIDDRVAHHAQHAVERHFRSLPAGFQLLLTRKRSLRFSQALGNRRLVQRAFLAATLAFDEWGHFSIISHIDV